MFGEELDDPTNNVPAETFTPAGAHLELQIFAPDGLEFRFPFLQSEIALGEHASAWRARLVGETVTLHHQTTGQTLLLPPGTVLEVEQCKVVLVNTRRPPLGRLEGISEPYTGRAWPIDSQQTRLGRRGKRFNHIEVNHPSISRAHASFYPDPQGRITLIAESAGSAVSLNGQALPPGEQRWLQQGDLLTLGSLQFRFHGSELGSGLLNVRSLGTFQVALGLPAEAGVQLTTKKAQWLLAALAADWGTARPVESLLDWLWPGLPLDRGRRNLSHTIARIREELQCQPEEFESLFLRTPSTLGLNPERLGTHDFHEVRKLTQTRAPLTSLPVLERLLDLYRGPFLPTCLEDWAERLRRSLEADLLQTLLATARYFHDQAMSAPAIRAGEKCLEIDRLDQEAVHLLMEIYLRSGRPERAIQLYQSHLRLLQTEGMEPGLELVKLHVQATMA